MFKPKQSKSDTNYTIEWIKPNDLTVLYSDKPTQRAHKVQHSEKIAESFDQDKVGVITVSRRSDNTNAVIDGQHRTHSLKMVGKGDVPVECHVYHGLTLREEAELFLGLNNVRNVDAQDKFAVRVTAEDSVAVRLNELLEQ